jgi:hypothetical protein
MREGRLALSVVEGVRVKTWLLKHSNLIIPLTIILSRVGERKLIFGGVTII